jgi:hypothetical protein
MEGSEIGLVILGGVVGSGSAHDTHSTTMSAGTRFSMSRRVAMNGSISRSSTISSRPVAESASPTSAIGRMGRARLRAEACRLSRPA